MRTKLFFIWFGFCPYAFLGASVEFHQAYDLYVLFSPAGQEQFLKENDQKLPLYFSLKEKFCFKQVFQEEKLRQKPQKSGLRRFSNLYLIESDLSESVLSSLAQELEKLTYVEFASIKLNFPAEKRESIDLKKIQIRKKTPDFFPFQGYLAPAQRGLAGMNILDAWEKTKGKGAVIRHIDGGIYRNHENFRGANLVAFNPEEPDLSYDHGTASAGVIIAQDVGFGIKGIAGSSHFFSYNLYQKDLLMRAIEDAKAGEILSMEFQNFASLDPEDKYNLYSGTLASSRLYWELMKALVNDGVIVVYPAGNGNNERGLNFGKSPHFQDWGDSGAIMVIASRHDTGGKADFSNYNSPYRQLNSWGDFSVMTTGYGEIFQGDASPNRTYTDSYGWTSSAQPLVVGALALVQSYAKGQLGKYLNTEEIFDIIQKTGYDSAQSGIVPKLEIGTVNAIAVLQKKRERSYQNYLNPIELYEILGEKEGQEMIQIMGYRILGADQQIGTRPNVKASLDYIDSLIYRITSPIEMVQLAGSGEYLSTLLGRPNIETVFLSLIKGTFWGKCLELPDPQEISKRKVVRVQNLSAQELKIIGAGEEIGLVLPYHSLSFMAHGDKWELVEDLTP